MYFWRFLINFYGSTSSLKNDGGVAVFLNMHVNFY